MTEWGFFLDKLIEDETCKTEDAFFDENEMLYESGVIKKKAGRPKGTVESEKQKAGKFLRKAKGHLLNSINRLEEYGRFRTSK